MLIGLCLITGDLDLKRCLLSDLFLEGFPPSSFFNHFRGSAEDFSFNKSDLACIKHNFIVLSSDKEQFESLFYLIGDFFLFHSSLTLSQFGCFGLDKICLSYAMQIGSCWLFSFLSINDNLGPFTSV